MSITHNQAVRLLAYLAAHDQRTVGEYDIQAWQEAGDLGGWTFEEAQVAVRRAANATGDRRVRPSDVTELIRAHRQDARLRAEADERRQARDAVRAGTRRALESGAPDGGHAGSAAMGEVRRAMGWPAETRRGRAFPCPHCHARTGVPCTRPGVEGVVELAWPHPSRSALAVPCRTCSASVGECCVPVGSDAGHAHPHHDRDQDGLSSAERERRAELIVSPPTASA